MALPGPSEGDVPTPPEDGGYEENGEVASDFFLREMGGMVANKSGSEERGKRQTSGREKNVSEHVAS